MSIYFDRYAYPEQLFSEQPEKPLNVIVVIPCFDEPDISTTLNSLKKCAAIDGVEVIIIINESKETSENIRSSNLRSISEINQWRSSNKPWFNLLFHHVKINHKDAGVGMARKIGMDEAARRFENSSNPQGVIACFDADSACSTNYFTELYAAYCANKEKPVGSAIYFEHLLPESLEHRNGIIQYELHLRYYVHALRMAGYPYSHQTVGSSMVVRSDVYQKIGGMNKRKAGEDFYFLHRLIPSGHFTDITKTCIYPSPRVSERVPFGTGKAMGKWLQENKPYYESYNLKSFQALKLLFQNIENLYNGKNTEISDLLDEAVSSFLNTENFDDVLIRLKKQSRSLSQFRKNFFAFFDGFKVLKYLHYSRDKYYPNSPILESAVILAEILWPKELIPGPEPIELLEYYRRKDRT